MNQSLPVHGDAQPSSTLLFQLAVRAGGEEVSGELHSVSRRGVFLRTIRPVEVGQPVQIFFYTLPHTALVVQGHVEWLESGGGCGIMFSQLSAYAATMIAELTARHPLSISRPAAI
ncbi:MAG: hypothetical protein ACI8S6_000266 [Myxococcota bacterium]|jgi:hypothetical protein